ncbi:MAG TPA: hypothetical protein DEQ38_14260 [Elusimicrobia bacterium]|nr:MAG: hypothetical protein A2089_07030 [Elusimicrobia bacterium GWD2_63_28]HCC49260.1 hypothetical protein [Elusimicrobiota bacterium]
MKEFKLKDMTRGWFVGNFSPACYKTKAAEAGIKTYRKGEREEAHFHKVATEITVIVSGSARINGVKYSAGDIIVIEPGESADFRALAAVKTVVVKVPGVLKDKFLKGPARKC